MRTRIEQLRLMLVTDGRGDLERVARITRSAIEGGVTAVQIREAGLDARAIMHVLRALRPVADAHGCLLLVNDRADVCAAGHADGVHLGGRSLDPAEVRSFLPAAAIVGAPAHDADELAAAGRGGVDYVLLSPVFETASKPAAEPLGPEAAAGLTAAATVPVLWLGGIDAENATRARAGGAAGVAVMSAIMAAADPASAAASLRAAVDG